MKMKMSRGIQFVVFAVLALIPTVLMTRNILSQQTVKCEVCMSHNGSQKCRSAQGPSKEECQRTATDNACAFLASGMTDSIKCTSQQPQSVKF